MDVRDGVNADRTVVQQWTCNIQARSMRWQPSTGLDCFFKFISAIGIAVSGRRRVSLQPGAQIQIYRCTQANTNTAQIWELRAIPGTQISEDTSPRGGDLVDRGRGFGSSGEMIADEAFSQLAAVWPVVG